jgi:hypothetical protein
MTPSPMSREVPKRPRRMSAQRPPRRIALTGVTSEVRARVPPSPRLSARSMKRRYFAQITRTSAQKTRERTPRMFSGAGPTPCSSRNAARAGGARHLGEQAEPAAQDGDLRAPAQRLLVHLSADPADGPHEQRAVLRGRPRHRAEEALQLDLGGKRSEVLIATVA